MSRERRSTRSRCTRCRDAVRLKDHILERWEAVDRKPTLAEDGALNVVVVGGGPTGVETAGAIAELYSGVFRQGLPRRSHRRARASSSSRPRPEIFAMFKENLRDVHRGGAREARRRGDDRRGGAVGRTRAGDAQVGNGARRRTRSSGARGSRGTSSSAPSASSSSAATASGSTTELTDRHAPRGLRCRRHRRDHGREDAAGPAAARLGRAPVGRARGRDDRAASSPARRRSRSRTGTRARWRRSAAVRPSCRCSAARR